jgi:hypothetical protein
MNRVILYPTPEQRETLRKTIANIMEQLLPIDRITTLNSNEAYLLWDLAVEVQVNVQLYANIVFEYYRKLNKPTQDNQQEILLRKIERALNNRGIDLSNLLTSVNEADMSKGDPT